MEIWKDIEGYDGFYQVSNLGNVRSTRFKNNKVEKSRIKELKTVTNKKKVIRDDGAVYESIRSCARENGVTQRSINDVLQGRKSAKTVKGHTFNYLKGVIV